MDRPPASLNSLDSFSTCYPPTLVPLDQGLAILTLMARLRMDRPPASLNSLDSFSTCYPPTLVPLDQGLAILTLMASWQTTSRLYPRSAINLLSSHPAWKPVLGFHGNYFSPVLLPWL